MIEILLAHLRSPDVDAIVNAATERAAQGFIRSIAFPGISTWSHAVPEEIAARIAIVSMHAN